MRASQRESESNQSRADGQLASLSRIESNGQMADGMALDDIETDLDDMGFGFLSKVGIRYSQIT
uniref:Uncharacterized protein n=1 Tax=Cucumis melo TaxID=3656 RepID=A0A9I9DLF4_CUCME